MINWNTRAYITTLNRLLTAQIEGIRVEGMQPQRQPEALQRLAFVEWEISSGLKDRRQEHSARSMAS
jgi:hypothetical protein